MIWQVFRSGFLIMPLRPVSQPFARGGLLVGSLLMLILALVSVSSFNAFNTVINFIYLPLIGICTWPRTDKIISSICIIFIFGLLLDIVSSGPLGLWSLIFLINFAVFKPHMRLKPLVFITAFSSWFSFLFFSSILLYFFAWFSIGISTQTNALNYPISCSNLSFSISLWLETFVKENIYRPIPS